MKKERSDLEKIIPEKEVREYFIKELYSGKPLLGKEGIFTSLLQGFVNAALEGEMAAHLGEEKISGNSNRRNGHIKKRVKSSSGSLEIKTPRDRSGDFEPTLIKKHSRRLGSGIDEIVLSLYARGHSVEDIRRHVEEIYGLEIGAGSISKITDHVLEELLKWQQRVLDPCYVTVYLDALYYKVRRERSYTSMAVYVVYGISVSGKRDVLGLYLRPSEGSGEWGFILEDLQKRGVEDILFACVDGLSGMKTVVETVYPKTLVQRCIVHMIRSSTRFVGYKDREKMIRDLGKVYKAADLGQAKLALEVFGKKWDQQYPEVRRKWEQDWDDLTVYLDYTQHLRRMLYTTNPVEGLHRILRKVTKSKGAWSNEKGLIKQLYLALKYNEKSWKTNVLHWNHIRRELMQRFGDRFIKWIDG